MAKKKGLLLTIIAAIGAFTGYANYMAKKDEFSDETKDKYDAFLGHFKDVGEDVKRTYISIGNKKAFAASTKKLTKSAEKAAIGTSELVKSMSTDMYNHAKTSILKAVDSFSNDDQKDIAKKKSNKKKNTSKNKKDK